MRKFFSVLVCMVLAVTAAMAKDLVNADSGGLALQGYDPVAFFTDGKAIKGQEGVTATYQGATYRFASEAHRDSFNRDPRHYAPAYGGFCAYAVSQGHTAPVEIDTWQIVSDRLLLNYSQKVKGLFDADRNGYIKKADGNWPQIVEKDGR